MNGRPVIVGALATLTDVGGITGSFVFTSGGQLIGRDIPAMFDDGALAEAAQRLSRLSDTFASVGDELELAVIRFQDHKLYLKVLAGGMLCILANEGVNMAVLRMAANLVGRRIAPELDKVDKVDGVEEGAPYASFVEEREPGGQSDAAHLPLIVSRSPVIPAGTRRFRGRTVE